MEKKPDFKFITSTITEARGCTDMLNSLSGSPLAVAVNIESWQFYSKGILNDCKN